MREAIATLHARMAEGGNWLAFRDEISSLYPEATTEEECLTLLEAYDRLVAVGPDSFDADTWARLLPATRGEYKLFLNMESMEGGMVNPVLLERVTRREVEAGRMSPEDGLRKLAISGAAVLGDSAEVTAHDCKRGDWLFFGAVGAVALEFGFQKAGISHLWIIAVALLAGWFINDRSRRRIKRDIEVRRAG